MMFHPDIKSPIKIKGLLDDLVLSIWCGDINCLFITVQFVHEKKEAVSFTDDKIVLMQTSGQKISEFIY